MTEMDITYIFIRYISITIKRQSWAFYRRNNWISYNENSELIESIKIEEATEWPSNSSSSFYKTAEEKLSQQEMIFEGQNSLNDMEKKIIYEKFLNQRTDVDIGRDFSVSSQMVSKRKRKILNKLKPFFYI